MRKPVQTTEAGGSIDRFRRVLTDVSLDCECRTKLDGVFDRFTAFERRRRLRSGLQQARHHRDTIASQLSFLAELDEITEGEDDRTVFEEIALLFDEIAAVAVNAAAAIREAES
jgi:hypothetical protein